MNKRVSKSTTKKLKTSATVKGFESNGRIIKNSSQVMLSSKRNNSEFTRNRPLSGNLLSSKMTQEVRSQVSLKSSTLKESHRFLNPSCQTSKKASQPRSLLDDNKRLVKENSELKTKVCRVRQDAVHDKQKIKNLITRIAEIKRPQSSGKTNEKSLTDRLRQTENKENKQTYCQNKFCEERRKYLESELYRERIKRNELQIEKKKWEYNKNELRMQYKELLGEIERIKMQK